MSVWRSGTDGSHDTTKAMSMPSIRAPGFSATDLAPWDAPIPSGSFPPVRHLAWGGLQGLRVALPAQNLALLDRLPPSNCPRPGVMGLPGPAVRDLPTLLPDEGLAATAQMSMRPPPTLAATMRPYPGVLHRFVGRHHAAPPSTGSPFSRRAAHAWSLGPVSAPSALPAEAHGSVSQPARRWRS